MNIDVINAVQQAHNYLQNLLNARLFSDNVKDLRLEEVELSEDEQFWLITLGYNRTVELPPHPLLGGASLSQEQREYKIFKIDANTGKVISMKIR